MGISHCKARGTARTAGEVAKPQATPAVALVQENTGRSIDKIIVHFIIFVNAIDFPDAIITNVV